MWERRERKKKLGLSVSGRIDETMAAPSPRKKLKAEVTCSVCLDFFTEPVILGCGHNFCRACISQCWGDSTRNVSCPQCRERFLWVTNPKPNRQLANLVEITKEMSAWEERNTHGWRLCERHQEPRKLFCKDDEAPICVVCDRSKEHREHDVVPVEEAAQEYQDWVSSSLEKTRKERERILAYKAESEKESQELLKQTGADKEKAVVAFRRLRLFLKEQEKFVVAQMEGLEKEITRKTTVHMDELSKELSSLENTIREMEQECPQAADKPLQDDKSTLQSREKEPYENLAAFPPALRWRIWECRDLFPFLRFIIQYFRDNLTYGLRLQKASITLDPATAHPQLILSEDCKSVRCGAKEQDLLCYPERFDKRLFVLGCEGFTAGKHYWEVSVGGEEEWAVGAARNTVSRKGYVDFSTQGGIWAVGKWDGGLWAYNHPFYTPLSLREEPKRIRVTLNHLMGSVAFFDADSGALIYSYTAASFLGETIVPFFRVSEEAQLTISP